MKIHCITQRGYLESFQNIFQYTPKSYYRKFGIVIKIFCLPFIFLFPRNNGQWHNLSHSKDLMSFLSYQRFTFFYENS